MKKIFLFVAAIVCLCSCAKEELPAMVVVSSGYSYYLQPQDKVRKGIKSITINEYTVEEKSGEEEKKLKEYCGVSNYNKDGLLISRGAYCEYEYVYSDNGKIKKTICNYFETNRIDINGKLVREFDENGNILKETYYNADGISYQPTVYQYDEKKRLIETKGLVSESTYDGYQEVTYKDKYIYNEKGWLIEKKTYHASRNAPERKTYYKYDKKGNCIESIEYDHEGEIAAKAVYEYRGRNTKITTIYDGDGNMKSKTEYTPNENIVYDENGNIVKRFIFEDKKLIEIFSYDNIWRIEYNKKGDCVRMTNYDLFQGEENVDWIEECEYTYY